uniref:Alanine racemase n=1 Tax=Candidatus Kentrum sp. FM TaxID=2126340 RepID=A0A450WBZ8_9GAMM|nr:MAG: alanine racemase [Candidatus Kentron sp. FM]VFJ63141.1 MAG: alanine racemase [Candidatus Kentron sp. FM]VFK14579.1 MAG: alanine racemase [Candidatus Kentron sp. FM]
MKIQARIDLTALGHNLATVRRHAPGTRVLAVIKSNGYGHGLLRVAEALSGADGFAVTNGEEALALREAGIRGRVLVLEGFSCPQELETLAAHGVDTVVHHESQIRMLEKAGAGPPVRVWLKIDTGMHRLGLPPAGSADAWARLRNSARVTGPVLLMTHLAEADDRQNTHTRTRIDGFHALAAGLGAKISIANSAAILAWPGARAGWVRPGIMLYGISPFPTETADAFHLLPVMTLSTRLIAVNRVPGGEAIGYGGTWVCPEEMPVGVAAIGYGDGYPRHAPSGCPVLVNGKRVPLIGRVCMDMITLDLRTQPDANIGDRVVLWGKGLPVEEVARLSGTIGYELVCNVTARAEFITREA